MPEEDDEGNNQDVFEKWSALNNSLAGMNLDALTGLRRMQTRIRRYANPLAGLNLQELTGFSEIQNPNLGLENMQALQGIQRDMEALSRATRGLNQVPNLGKIVNLSALQALSSIEIPKERIHLSKVRSAYENDNTEELVIFLNVFFESYISSLLTEYCSQNGVHPGLQEHLSNLKYGRKLSLCFKMDLIDEEENSVIREVKKARDKYAHDISYYHFDEETHIEQGQRLEKAIKLYQESLQDSGITLRDEDKIIEYN